MNGESRLKPLWTTNFKIDDAKWNEILSRSKSENKSPIVIAIESGLVDENALLNFERERSKLPSLKAAFFDGEPPMDLWAGCNFESCIKSSSMPVATWDEKIYWAKLSGDTLDTIADNPSAMWVLAPWSGLKKWFQIWQSSQQAKVPKSFDPTSVLQTNTQNSPAEEPSEDGEGVTLVPEIDPDADMGPPAGFEIKGE